MTDLQLAGITAHVLALIAEGEDFYAAARLARRRAVHELVDYRDVHVEVHVDGGPAVAWLERTT